jgi:hypothetical protein
VKYRYSDPMIVLSGAERERAATSRVFVEEDCSSMSLSQLATRIEAVAAGDDKVAQYLHARYARKRMDAEHARVDELRRRGGNETLPEGELMARRRLIDLVEDLEGKVSPRSTKPQPPGARGRSGRRKRAGPRQSGSGVA